MKIFSIGPPATNLRQIEVHSAQCTMQPSVDLPDTRQCARSSENRLEICKPWPDECRWMHIVMNKIEGHITLQTFHLTNTTTSPCIPDAHIYTYHRQTRSKDENPTSVHNTVSQFICLQDFKLFSTL